MNWSICGKARAPVAPRVSRARLAPARRSVLLLGMAACLPAASWACATCGCTVNADAVLGYPTTSGWRLNIEYDYIDQDQLRTGTGPASPSQVVNDPSNPVLGGGEIEHETLNRYIRLGLSYQANAAWNISATIPYILRDHSTFGEQQAPYSGAEIAPDQLSFARVSNLGDAKLLASFQGLLPEHNLGLQLGIKLPTGQDGIRTDFQTGPAHGTALDASLQAGTGSTDLIAGAYYSQTVSRNFDGFAAAQFQAAAAEKLDRTGFDYRPGNSSTLSVGLRYEASPRWLPQLQFVLFHKDADQGALADTTDSAGTVLYASPGITMQLLSTLHAYTVLQLPVYSKLSGYQLFARWTATAGLSYAF